LSLERGILRVDGQETQRIIFNYVIPHVVRDGKISWNFVPQGTIHPTLITVKVMDNLGVAGPLRAQWRNNHPVTLTWTTH
jgi:hypothetical protein